MNWEYDDQYYSEAGYGAASICFRSKKRAEKEADRKSASELRDLCKDQYGGLMSFLPEGFRVDEATQDELAKIGLVIDLDEWSATLRREVTDEEANKILAILDLAFYRVQSIELGASR